MIVVVVVVLVELIQIILQKVTFYKVRRLENIYLRDFLEGFYLTLVIVPTA